MAARSWWATYYPRLLVLSFFVCIQRSNLRERGAVAGGRGLSYRPGWPQLPSWETGLFTMAAQAEETQSSSRNCVTRHPELRIKDLSVPGADSRENQWSYLGS